MLLFIDTTSTRIIIQVNGTKVKKTIQSPRGEDILKLIEVVLKKANVTKEKLTEIEVNPGPGPSIDLNVGVAVANALGTSLKIPVNRQKPGVFVKPIYKESPNTNGKS